MRRSRAGTAIGSSAAAQWGPATVMILKSGRNTSSEAREFRRALLILAGPPESLHCIRHLS